MMSEPVAAPPKKRRRSDKGEDPTLRIRSRYWFEDGNIVLQAENTFFRVHRSVLSTQSQIFKDTFAMPQGPSEEDEVIEGCAVVQMSDAAEDVRSLISLLYDSAKMLSFGYKLPAKVLGAMLRLGRKYDIAHLVKDALERLHHDYPKTLDDWDSLRLDNRRIEYDDKNKWEVTEEIIRIAHEFGLSTIMPAAYAQYIQLFNPRALVTDLNLPQTARAQCISGRVEIQEFVKDRMLRALRPPVVLPSCGRAKCGTDGWNTIKNLSVWRTGSSTSFGIFQFKESKAVKDLCSRCRVAVEELTSEVRMAFWSTLPTFFELGEWEDLKDSDILS